MPESAPDYLSSQLHLQDDETALFRKSWTLYDAISERNYMFHREIYAHVADLLRQRHQTGPYHLLDLGCGNARFLAPCLHSAPPALTNAIADALGIRLTALPASPDRVLDALTATRRRRRLQLAGG